MKQYKNDYKRRRKRTKSKFGKNSSPSIYNINSWRFWILKKTNALLNLINHEPVIDEIYLYSKGQYVAKYQLLSSKKGSQAQSI